MIGRRKRGAINIPAPYLRRVWVDPSQGKTPGLSLLPAVFAGGI